MSRNRLLFSSPFSLKSSTEVMVFHWPPHVSPAGNIDQFSFSKTFLDNFGYLVVQRLLVFNVPFRCIYISSVSLSVEEEIKHRQKWLCFCEGETWNHITVCWQRRNTQPSVTSRLSEPPAFRSLCSVSLAWTLFQTRPRSFARFHIRIRWGSETGCPFFADTRTLVWEKNHHECS